MPRRVRQSEDQLVLDEIPHRHFLAGHHAVRGVHIRGLGVDLGQRPGEDQQLVRFHIEGHRLAVVEYALAPEARMDWIVGEVRHAISWLHEHLGDYGADPGRIYVAGHSAGGHLTAMTMTMTLGAVRGGIAISGLYDLEPIRLNYLNEKLGLDEAETRRNSPMLNFPTMAGPLIVTYGTAELSDHAVKAMLALF